MDHFSSCVRAVAAVLGKSAELPAGSASAGRGGIFSMPSSIYLAARVVFEGDPIVEAALKSGSLEVSDDGTLDLALALARAQHAPLIAAAKALAAVEALGNDEPSNTGECAATASCPT